MSQLNVVMAHRDYFRRNNPQILKLATYTKIEHHYSGRVQIGNFLDWKGLSDVHISFVYTTHQVLLICNKEICVAKLMIK